MFGSRLKRRGTQRRTSPFFSLAAAPEHLCGGRSIVSPLPRGEGDRVRTPARDVWTIPSHANHGGGIREAQPLAAKLPLLGSHAQRSKRQDHGGAIERAAGDKPSGP